MNKRSTFASVVSGKIRALKGVVWTVRKQPQSSLSIIAELPAILRGINYAKGWKSFTVSHRSLKLSNSLYSYFSSHKKGRGIWKWTHYFDIYHQYFQGFIGREVHILEIGVYSGGSLQMWKNYFGLKCHVYGVDLEKACKVYENKYTKIFIGDQADRRFWKRFKNEVPKLDIIVDDGGHQFDQQIVTLEELLPHLAPGGVYICEDINCPDNVFISYLHGLVKSLNEEDGGPINGVKPRQFQSWIKSIHFYPYAVVIEKADRPVKQFIAPRHGTEWQPFYDRAI